MSISVVIPVHSDHRVLSCIDSLRNNQVEYEVLVVLTENSADMAELLSSYEEVRVTSAPYGNLSMSLNIGIKAGKYEKIVILNADTYCAPGYLDQLSRSLNEHSLVRSRIAHEYITFWQRLVAELRNYTYEFDVFFSPAISFRKNVKNAIGGYFFNDKVWWTEDAELNWRIHQKGLAIFHNQEAVVMHLPETLRHDLKAALKIGAGKFCQVVYASRSPWDESILMAILRIVCGKSLRNIIGIARSKGYPVAVYAAVWKMFYLCGYHIARIRYFFKVET